VVGARPNFMKVKPVMDALEAAGAEVILVHTGQHYDAALSSVFFTELGLRAPDYLLNAGSGSHATQTGRIMCEIEALVDALSPDVCVVAGDVNSSLAAAVVAAKAGSLVAHVEAGLRSRDWSMPEEINRVLIDRCSDYLLAPSQDAVLNLESEGYRPDQIHLVGNTMADTLFANLQRARGRSTLADLGLREHEYGLVTLHRPANVDDAATLSGLLGALEEVAKELPLVFPAHPRTADRLEALRPRLVRVLPPSGYLDFIALQAGARLVLTDSGGVQEETTMLGVPCLTLRDNTERPITVSEGTNRLVGTEPAAVLRAAHEALVDNVAARRPALWDGRAGQRIAAVLLGGGTAASRLRPTELAIDPLTAT
jgi:UDP-N-acetylglucosamine 2-epimerase (non-hydrolysing)